MDTDKTEMYTALGVATFLEHTIQEYRKQYGRSPAKIILGRLEWKLLGVEYDAECYSDGVFLSLNSNINCGIITVDDKV